VKKSNRLFIRSLGEEYSGFAIRRLGEKYPGFAIRSLGEKYPGFAIRSLGEGWLSLRTTAPSSATAGDPFFLKRRPCLATTAANSGVPVE